MVGLATAGHLGVQEFMSTRLRIILPSLMGAISAPLAIWDIHNSRVIESMGMAWDTGAPLWPYQTPDILLRFLDGPAYFVAMPISNLFRLAVPEQYIFVFPAILLWWWLLGQRLDVGLVSSKPRRPWLFFMALVACTILLLLPGAIVSADAIRWWFKYGGIFRSLDALLMMVRFLSPAAWCVALAVLFVLAAKKIAGR